MDNALFQVISRMWNNRFCQIANEFQAAPSVHNSAQALLGQSSRCLPRDKERVGIQAIARLRFWPSFVLFSEVRLSEATAQTLGSVRARSLPTRISIAERFQIGSIARTMRLSAGCRGCKRFAWLVRFDSYQQPKGTPSYNSGNKTLQNA